MNRLADLLRTPAVALVEFDHPAGPEHRQRLVALRPERRDQGGADEPGRSGDRDPHDAPQNRKDLPTPSLAMNSAPRPGLYRQESSEERP